MSTLTQAPVLVPPPGRVLPPRARALRPAPAAAPPLKDPRTLDAWRATINRTAVARSGGPLSVVLYALTRPGGDPHTDLAAAQQYADAQRLLVVDRIVDTLARDDQACADQPELRRGYARTLHLLGDPTSPVRGLVTVSQTAVSRVDRLYEAELARYAALRVALFLVRAETEI
ncbi:hypothetical protein [Streptomyces cinereoruber]